jgi:hypothetical protein
VTDETGFFRFDTNAGVVADDISAAMARIHRALAEGSTFDQGALSSATQQLGGTFKRVESELSASAQRVKGISQRYAKGLIPDQGEFQRQIHEEIGGVARKIPQMLADEMALAPKSTAATVNASAMGRSFVEDYIASARQHIKAETGTFQGLFKNTLQPYATEASHIDYGNETSRMQQLINRVRAEQYAAVDQNGMTAPSHMRNYVREIGSAQTNYEGEFKYSGAIQELADLTRAQRDAESTAARLGRQFNQTAKEAEELAAADRVLAEYTKVGGQYVDDHGNVAKAQGVGAGEQTNQLRAEEARQAKAQLDAEKANFQHLSDQYMSGNATKLGASTYVVGNREAGAEVYRANTTTQTAQRLESEIAIEEALRSQEKILANVAAREELAARTAAKRQASQESQGVAGGLFSRLNRGENSITTTIGAQIGSAALFTAAYGSIFAVTGALRDMLKEFLDYQDSLTDLDVATNHSGVVTQGFVNDLSDLARVSGANVGQSLDTAARGIRAFGSQATGTKDQIKQEMREIGEATNAAATKLSLISDKALPDATGDLVAAGTAFGLRPDQLNQVVDAVANAKRNVGGDAGQISQGLALIANAAQEAGFNLNEAAAVIGLVQARTDESGQAIATRLTRIFQIVGGSTGKSLAREFQSYGVNPNDSVKDQLTEYAKIYSDKGTSSATRDRISSALGGTANLRELLPLLKENKTLTEAYKKALDNVGQGTTEFDRKTNNLVGTLKKIKGDLKAIEVGASISGVFDPFAVALKTAEPMLHLLDRMLQLWNEMPTPVRAVAGGILDVVAALKLYSVIQARSAAAKGIEAAVPAGLAARGAMAGATAADMAVSQAAIELNAAKAAETRAVIGATEARVAAEARFDEAIAAQTVARAEVEALSNRERMLGGVAGAEGAALSGVRGGAATALGFLTNPVVVGIAGVVATAWGVNKYMDAREQDRGFNKAFSGAQNTFGTYDGTSKSLSASAFDLKSAAGNLSKSQANFMSRHVRDDEADKLKGQAEAIGKIAKAVADEQGAAATARSTDVFGGPLTSVEQLGSGLEALTNSGASATEQFHLLAKALDSAKAPAARQTYQPAGYAAAFTDINAALKKALPDTVKFQQSRQVFNGYTNTPSVETVSQSRDKFLADHSLKGKQITDLNSAVQDFMAKRGVRPGGAYSDSDVKATSDFVANYLVNQLGIDPTNVKDLKGKITKSLFAQVKKSLSASDASSLLNGNGAISNSDLLTLLQGNKDQGGTYGGLFAAADASLGEIPSGDDGTVKEASLKRKLAVIEPLLARARRSGEDTPTAVLVKVQSYEQQLAETTVARLEKLRKIAGGATNTTAAQAASRDQVLVRQEIDAAIKGGDATLLAQVIASAGQGAIAIAKAAIEHALKVARAARIADQEATAAARASAIRLANGEGGMVGPDPSQIPIPKSSKKENTYKNLLKGLENDTAKDTPQEIASAKAALAATNAGGGQLATAAAAVTSAQADLHAATPKTVAWYNAQAALHKAQQDYADALRAVGPAQLSAQASKLGGGLAPARAQIASARAALATAEKGTVEWYEALGQLYEGQRSYSAALVAYKNNIDQLHGDITDPVENARDSLRAAQRQLSADRGAGKDVKAEDRVNVRQTQAALESAKFSQRLSDVQTAEQLGQISHAKYIQYLEHEHDRLEAIKHRTRQQQDELNQVDLAMKDAKDAAEGQFNLGDINTNGLVYQERRQAAEARAARASTSLGNSNATTQQTVTISVNGADVGKVQQIIRTYLNAPVNQNQTLSRRKVR